MEFGVHLSSNRLWLQILDRTLVQLKIVMVFQKFESNLNKEVSIFSFYKINPSYFFLFLGGKYKKRALNYWQIKHCTSMEPFVDFYPKGFETNLNFRYQRVKIGINAHLKLAYRLISEFLIVGD